MNIGIDKLNIFAPHLYLDLTTLATARQIDPNKFTLGIGQEKMAVMPLTQDTVSLGANAADPIVTAADAELIDLVILGTESGFDYSKAGATYIHQLLGINPFARSIEIKQACYGATAGLMMARDYIKQHPDRKALVIASDIARYGLKTPGEATQGAGAVAMVISADPDILIIDDLSVPLTDNIFDFWRPVYADNALVDGKFSNEAYISFFAKTWQEYQRQTGAELADFTALCFHLPYSKMGKKALLPHLETVDSTVSDRLLTNYDHSTTYTKAIGNIYTGSLYLGFASLLDHQADLEVGQRIGFFSYGSGAVAEFFTGRLAANFKEAIRTTEQQTLLNQRQALSMTEYEALFQEKLPMDGTTLELAVEADPAPIRLANVTAHQRHYTKR